MSTNAKSYTVDLADIVRDPEGTAAIIFNLMRERDDWRTQATQRADTMHALLRERDDAIDQRDTYRANMEAADKACMNALALLAEHEQSRADYIRDAIAEVKDRVREAVTTALND